MPEDNSKSNSPSLDPVNITVGILTNIASTILEHHAQKLQGTLIGKALKIAGLIEPDFYDRLESLLSAAADYFFANHENYKRQTIIDFFQDKMVAKALADSILDDLPVNYELLEECLNHYLNSDLEAQQLMKLRQLSSPKTIVDDFFDAYRHVRRKHLSTGQVALLEAIEANRTEIRQNQALLEKLYSKVEHETSMLQRLKDHFRLINLDDFTSATAEIVNTFYTGKYPLKWELIKAKATIQRDQKDQIIEDLSSPPSGLEIVCITGEMGDGKSSLAWEVALQVANNIGYWLLQVRSNQVPEAWHLLENAVVDSGRKGAVVLVDDLFRDDSFVQALQDMRADIPVKVIATSRLNEIPNHLTLARFRTIQLLPPSDHEKQLVLERLGLHTLNAEQRQRLKKATNWLVLMIETTAGESLKTVIRDNVKRLQKIDTHVYEAYEYICFAGQFDILFPEVFLNILDVTGHFYKIYEKPTASGLIFMETNVWWGQLLRPSHALIAQESLSVYSRDPQTVLRKFFESADFRNRAHRQFLQSILLALITNGQHIEVEIFLKNENAYFHNMITFCGHHELFNSITNILKKLQKVELLKQIRERILTAIPLESDDWASKMIYVRRYATQYSQDIIFQVAIWLEHHAEDVIVRRTYLYLVKEKGSKEQIGEALDSTQIWLEHHADDVQVRSDYLNLVKEKGSKEQVAEAIDSTQIWLQHHHEDVGVRSNYLMLIKEKGNAHQIAEALDSTPIWLEHHDDDVIVRSTYLNLVKEKGQAQQIAEVLDSTQIWLQHHDDDVIVRSTYLNLVKEKVQAQQIAEALDSTQIWLEHHDDDVQVRSTYLNLVKE
ncbi:MAG: hypothetical protein K8L97_28300, partial [Anaerolineae bacterium]|nr:hypothetical protein [Anaerolineae bacterium]